jgi:hypothetical protein
LVDEVIGEVSEGASENVVIVHFPCGDEGIKLWPPLYGFFKGLNFSDVCHLLIKAA